MERSSRQSARTAPARAGTRCPERSAHQGGRVRRCLEVEHDTLDPALHRLAAAVIRAGGTDPGDSDFGGSDFDCTDLGSTDDIPAAQRRALTDWRLRREVFSDLELLVLEYAEAVTATPPLVRRELTNALIERLGHRQSAELTAVVALESVRVRMESIDRDAGEAADAR